MDKREFLEILKGQLSGQMPEERVAGHMRYYRDYIEDAVRRGKSEDVVIGELGDPRLIAKTLVDTGAAPEQFSSGEGNGSGGYGNSSGYGGGSGYGGDSGGGYEGYEDADSGAGYGKPKRVRRLDLSTWWGKAIVILIAAAALALLFVALSVILPIFVIGCVVIYLVSHFRKK